MTTFTEAAVSSTFPAGNRAGVSTGAAASRIEVRSDVAADRWNAYVSESPEATAYHAAEWAGIIERAFGHRTKYLAAVDGGRIVGVLPLVFFSTPLFGRFATSMPFLNYGGVAADNDEAAEALLAAGIAEATAARALYLELRHSRRRFERQPVQTHKVAMVLPLHATADDQWRTLDRKIRNQVRKAEKSNLVATVGGVELLDWFYDVLSRNMRDLGSPVHAPAFFREILTAFPESSRILTVSLDGKAIGASFMLWHRGTLEVPWASTIREYNPLCPNMLLYWEMLKFGIGQRMARFDFGRSTPHEGTYQFKQQWGAEPQQLYWEYWLADGARLPDRSPKNPKFSAVIGLWRRMPVRLTRALGPLLVRNIP